LINCQASLLKDLQFQLDCLSESWAVTRPWIFQADDVELQLLQLVLVLVPPLSLPTELPLHLVLMPPLSLPAGLHNLGTGTDRRAMDSMSLSFSLWDWEPSNVARHAPNGVGVGCVVGPFMLHLLLQVEHRWWSLLPAGA